MRNLFKGLSNTWLQLCRTSWNLQWLSEVLWTQFRQELVKMGRKNIWASNLCPQAKYGSDCTHFYTTITQRLSIELLLFTNFKKKGRILFTPLIQAWLFSAKIFTRVVIYESSLESVKITNFTQHDWKMCEIWEEICYPLKYCFTVKGPIFAILILP